MSHARAKSEPARRAPARKGRPRARRGRTPAPAPKSFVRWLGLAQPAGPQGRFPSEDSLWEKP